MLEAPDAADLLATARASLLEKLLPALPPHLHYEARMAANALAIAGRAIGADAAAVEARLGRLAGDQAGFARRIRAGEFAPGTPQHAEAASVLAELVRLRCSVSAPRALK
ncbi:DUF6285 domain-containing protein [Roseococcus sp. YIM B11640]|uniref:DUF6285 domain-containing protein n=1 Tax=Roseococcus sp. YIM B11640 TaxID=3133973 RepID=UPI003C7B6202